MNIIPAIDLKNGHCVRLKKGHFEDIAYYDVKPEKVAKAYERDGASWLHLVDLDGAQSGTISQRQIINRIVQTTNLNVQVGGGIQSPEIVETLLNQGASRVVIGSLAVYDRTLTSQMLKQFSPDRIVLALDVHVSENGVPMVVTHGWQTISEVSLEELIHDYQSEGLKHVLCTDISFDGMLTGPNNALYQWLLNQYPTIRFYASGGVASLNDIALLKASGVSDVIIGKALYENRFSLREALNVS